MTATWKAIVERESQEDYYKQLKAFVDDERKKFKVFPGSDDVYAAFRYTPLKDVKVMILGQDPYHDDGQAHGLSFSVLPGVRPPPSLVNIFKELHEDVGFKIPNNGNLVPWAKQGVLLLNAVLTVRAHQAASHRNKGWEMFSDVVIREVNNKPDRVVFVLWGAYARKKAALIDTKKHVIIQSAHPSPLSAANGFLGSKPFSKINKALRDADKTEIDWQLPNV